MDFTNNSVPRGEGYKRLKESVINYRFRPYQPLQIDQLAERFNIGRTPLREALTRLHVESLVLAVPSRGFFAKMLTIEEMNARFEFGFLILQFAISSNPQRRAFSSGPTGTLSSHGETGANGVDPSAAVRAFAAWIEELYVEIAELSGNPVMVDSIRSFNEHTHYVRLIDIGCNGPEIDADHRRLIECLTAGKAEDAVATLRRHVDAVLARMDGLVKQGNLRSLGSSPV